MVAPGSGAYGVGTGNPHARHVKKHLSLDAKEFGCHISGYERLVRCISFWHISPPCFSQQHFSSGAGSFLPLRPDLSRTEIRNGKPGQ